MNLHSSDRDAWVAFCGPIMVSLTLAAGLAAIEPAVGAAGEPLFDNARVTVWDSAKGQPQRTNLDRVVIDVTTNSSAGTVSFEQAGAAVAPSAKASRVIIVELKDTAVPALKNTSAFPNAFPRPGSKKL